VPHMTLLNVRKTSRWSQKILPAEISVMTRESVRQATLVEFRGSNLSDAGSIPAIST
jgi:hypothetical protein